MERLPARIRRLAARVFPWPLLPAGGPLASAVASAAALAVVAASRLLLLPSGPWEQDEALLACGVIDFDPARHMPLPPGFPLWIAIGKTVRKLGVADPLVALQVASALLSVVAVWALVGLWEGVAGRRVALAGAALAAFIPGVWFHAGRALSETPSAALAVIALALWLRGGRAGFVPGVAAMTAAALVRPPLAPIFVLAVVLAAWWARREARLVAAGVAAGAAVLTLVMVPAALAAGGWGMLLQVSETHAGEHFATLGTESWALDSLGLVRGLGTPAFAALFLALAAIGWWGWKRTLGARWWAGTIACATLVFVLVFMDNRNYPRYWVLVWLLLATPAVAGAARLGRSRAAGLAAAAVGVGAAVWWGYPAVRYIHRHRLPVVAALETAAAQGPGLLIFEDQLFSFRNLAAVTGRLPLDSLRLSEMEQAGGRLAGAPVWLLAEEPGEDVPCPVSRVARFECRQARVWRLSQERFLRVRLVRDPVLVARGGYPLEFDGSRRFVWCGARAALLAPRVNGPGTLALALDGHPSLREAPAAVRVDGVPSWSGAVSAGPQVIAVPLPPAAIGAASLLWVELDLGAHARSAGDDRSLAVRLFGASLQAPPLVGETVTFVPERDSLLGACAEAEGTYAPELLGNPPRPAAWAGAHAAFTFPAGPGLVGVELLAPSARPAVVTVRLGTSRATVTVGPEPATVVLPVPDELARVGRVRLELESTTFVPGGGDSRSLGVAVDRVWYVPSGPPPAGG